VHNLGQTRSSQKPNYLLLTADTFVRTALPGMKACSAIVHVGPALGAKFSQYTAEFEAGGELGSTTAQRFIFVMEGAVTLEVERKRHKLVTGGYAYLPEGVQHRVVCAKPSRVAIIEKPYQAVASVKPPRLIVSNEDAVSPHPLGDDPDLQVKCLLPDEMSFDFAVNTMTLEGGGIYRLGDSWYPVTAGDFIWMGPWCPQWFGALGKVPSKYLIYKDWNRHPLADCRP
jgi:(S)-ureidoglycine aminohydrolase